MKDYTQYGPITNGGVRVHGDAAVRYMTILCVGYIAFFQLRNFKKLSIYRYVYLVEL